MVKSQHVILAAELVFCVFFQQLKYPYQVQMEFDCRSIVMDWKSMQVIFSLRLLSSEVD